MSHQKQPHTTSTVHKAEKTMHQIGQNKIFFRVFQGLESLFFCFNIWLLLFVCNPRIEIPVFSRISSQNPLPFTKKKDCGNQFLAFIWLCGCVLKTSISPQTKRPLPNNINIVTLARPWVTLVRKLVQLFSLQLFLPINLLLKCQLTALLCGKGF